MPVYGTLLGNFRVRPDLFIGPSDIEPSYSWKRGLTATFDHEFNAVLSEQVKVRWSQSEFDQLSQILVGCDATGVMPAIAQSTVSLANPELFHNQE